MASLKVIRKRISTVRSTQQVTKAMKMVAAAKLRRAQLINLRAAVTRHAQLEAVEQDRELFLAEMEENKDIAKLLIMHADVNLRTAGGASPLHMAAARDARDVETLLDKGAHIDAQDNRGWTALHTAVSANQLEVVKLLLEKGADPGLKNKRDETANDVAHKKGFEEIGNLFD